MQSDEYYIKRILNDSSETAAICIVKKYERQVFNLCFRILRSRELAEEIAQDAFVKSLGELKKLNDHSKFGGWLMRITYRLAIDEIRKKRPDLVSLDTDDITEIEDYDNSPNEALEHADKSEVIELLLKKLSPIDNSLITLYHLDDMSIKEVAEVVSMTESNVKIRLMRARKRLKKGLERYMGSELKNIY